MECKSLGKGGLTAPPVQRTTLFAGGGLVSATGTIMGVEWVLDTEDVRGPYWGHEFRHCGRIYRRKLK